MGHTVLLTGDPIGVPILTTGKGRRGSLIVSSRGSWLDSLALVASVRPFVDLALRPSVRRLVEIFRQELLQLGEHLQAILCAAKGMVGKGEFHVPGDCAI